MKKIDFKKVFHLLKQAEDLAEQLTAVRERLEKQLTAVRERLEK